MTAWTHRDLVLRAQRWLHNTKHNSVTLIEVKNFGEEPDVIGWKSGFSTLIECKATRSDFLKDAKKYVRMHPEFGMGYYRSYFAPQGLIDPKELPANWGLLEPIGRTVKEVVKPQPFYTRNMASEVIILASAVQRVTDGWGRKIFGHKAPAGLLDGDPHPTAAARMKQLRAENDRLRGQLQDMHRKMQELQPK